MRNVLRVGLVGVPRSYALAPAFQAQPAVEIVAVCDAAVERAAWLATSWDAKAYDDYERLLDDAALDAVFLGTPMPLHARQAITALDRNIHVLCEVPAAMSIDEGRALARAAASSSAVYMLAENYCFSRTNAVVRGMAHAGVFGDMHFAGGEYLHNCKEMNERTPWRRQWQTGIDGCTYGTHSLGRTRAATSTNNRTRW